MYFQIESIVFHLEYFYKYYMVQEGCYYIYQDNLEIKSVLVSFSIINKNKREVDCFQSSSHSSSHPTPFPQYDFAIPSIRW